MLNLKFGFLSFQPLYINLDTLHDYCKGDKDKELRFLMQFLEMIPLSIHKIQLNIEEKDRSKLLKEIHFMSPHLLFFGIEDFSDLTKREKEIEHLPFDVLKSQVFDGLDRIERAIEEARTIIENQSNSFI